MKAKFKQDKKTGKIVSGGPQDTNKNGTGGRPCGYCSDPKVQEITNKYIEECSNQAKPKIPYIQELAIRLDTWADILEDWEDKKLDSGELEHPDFYRSCKKIRNMQQFKLLERTLGRFNPTGAIFQLKVNHKYIETEKKLLVGDPDNPLHNKYDITITEARGLDEE